MLSSFLTNLTYPTKLPCINHLVGIVVKGRPGLDPRWRRGSFSRSSHTRDVKIGNPVATLPGVLRCRVSAGAGWSSVSTLLLCEIESFIYNFCLSGLVVKSSASGAEDPGFEFRLRRDFSGSSHTSDLNIGTPVATLPGAWRYRVSTGTGWTGVSIL